jgi:magnesium chelatase family protein
VTIVRHLGVCRMPARFQLVAALNPCPCGSVGTVRTACRCTPGDIRGYLGRLSGPLLDRIDLHVTVPAPAFDEIAGPAAESTKAVRGRVVAARTRQAQRTDGTKFSYPNALLPSNTLRKLVATGSEGERLLRHAVDRLGLSARGLDRILRVARTISDLSDSNDVKPDHLAEALHFRRALDDAALTPL